MRTEQEVYNLILNIANNDEKILAVYMNGSRTNINAPRDIFQDYDIIFVVNETKEYIDNKNWINIFGEILYMQYPDEFPNSLDKESFYGYLMQFTDGIRIDLHIETIEHAKKHILDDKLCNVLLDKQNILPIIPTSTDSDYWVKKPTEQNFQLVCNEFWWCTNSLAKGLWRNEMTYVQDIANFHVRKQLETLLSWKVGIITNFSLSIGKSGKYLYKWLDAEEWNKYLETYFDNNPSNAWLSIEKMCQLFTDIANWLEKELGYTYNHKEAKNAKLFLNTIKHLPKDAKEINIEVNYGKMGK